MANEDPGTSTRQPWYHLVCKFTDRERFRAWVESGERDHWLGRARS
jgi:antibiotic biosynthesis monooxygenase (ABM) superfamily enzyme